jgi:sulfite exporter TauE/SafE
MTQLIIAAFTIGLLGSFHCVGMCGPLALSLPLNSDSFWSKFSGALLYNIGRIVTYATFGLVFGTIGKSVSFFGYQQWLSIAMGIFIIFFVVVPKRFSSFNNNNIVIKFLENLRTALAKLFTKDNHFSLFSIGLLNGLLPCGLVYMAAAGAIATGDILKSVVFMSFFGLGTLPIMWSVAFFGNYIGISIRQKIRTVYPYLMTIMACLLILRGMGLGIPYVSPLVEKEKQVVQGCCAKP